MASELEEFRWVANHIHYTTIRLRQRRRLDCSLAWKRELEQQSSANAGGSSIIQHDHTPSGSGSATPVQSEKAQLLSRPPPVSQAHGTTAATSKKHKQPQSAVDIYGAAVQAEREGRLNDALQGYRTALRMDDKVDKLYHRLQTQAASSAIPDSSNDVDDVLAFEYQRTLQLEPDYERQKQLKSRMLTTAYINKLTTMFRASPYDPITRSHQEAASTDSDNNSAQESLQFFQKSSLRGIPIAKLPDEILLHILSIVTHPSPNAQYPDISSLERGFGMVSRKARILTLSSVALWKAACLNTYKSPLQLENLTCETSSQPITPAEALASKLYANDYRLMWIEQPRIRTDGVYISQITYLRRGVQEGSMYTPMHYVEYYRYLCFLPSGYVVSLLSHDPPKMVVPTLLSSSHPSSKDAQPGYTVGRWRLRNLETVQVADATTGAPATVAGGTIVQLTSLEDPRITSPEEIKYSFKMTCRLKSTSRGRMNKLEMLSLAARNHRTEEEAPIPVKQAHNNAMPSFFFSRVLSYD